MKAPPHTARIIRICALLCLCLVSGAALPGRVAAGEVIRSFDSSVEILPNGSIMVTETIRFVAEGKKIRRGLYRDIPLAGAGGRNARFDVEEMRIDGVKSSHYAVERHHGAVRVRLGNPAHNLNPGEHTFVLVYTMTRQLYFFGDTCELGWNVTGDKWEFDIEQSTCRVVIPFGGGGGGGGGGGW